MYCIQSMTLDHAKTISNWVYPDEYAVYSFEPSQALMDELLDSSYYACTDSCDQLVGYFCFGFSAQISTVEGYAYSLDKLDIGLGLAPELCGHGIGADFLRAGMDFAGRKWNPTTFRLTVAEFNLRAQRVYRRLGFCPVASVTHKNTGMRFQIMEHIRQEVFPC